MIVVNAKIGSPRVSFTPSAYKTVYNEYEQGVYGNLIAMMKRAALDSYIAGCLMGRRAGFMREFNILPFSDAASDIERAQIIQNMIRRLNYRNLFKAIQEALLMKFKVIDFDWEVQEGLQMITGFKAFEQKYFRYKDGLLMIDFGNDLRQIPPETLVCESDETPVMLPVLRDYILKEFGWEAWAGFVETFGQGIILGKYPPGAGADIKTDLQTAVDAIARSSRGTLPDNTDIDIRESNRTTGDHQKFVEAADKGIAITILGHANAVEQSKGLQVGENLTSFEVKGEIAKDDMYYIDSQMQKLVHTICIRNWNDGKEPFFQTDKSDPVNVTEWIDVLDTAYSHGVILNPAEYQKLGLQIYPEQKPLQKQDIELLD